MLEHYATMKKRAGACIDTKEEQGILFSCTLKIQYLSRRNGTYYL